MNSLIYITLCISILSLQTSFAKEIEIAPTEQERITKELVLESKEKFVQFLEKQDENYKKLESWTNPNWLFGSLVSKTIEFVSPMTRYGHIEPEKSKIFLGRAFEDIEQLKNSIDTLSQSQANIAYLNTILNELSDTDLKNRDIGTIAKAMIGKEHPEIKDTSQMGSKNKNDQYIIPNEKFYLFAVTNLFATFCVDEGIFIEKKRNRKRTISS